MLRSLADEEPDIPPNTGGAVDTGGVEKPETGGIGDGAGITGAAYGAVACGAACYGLTAGLLIGRSLAHAGNGRTGASNGS